MTIHNVNDIPGRVVAFRCAKPHREALGPHLTAWRIGRGVWAIVHAV